MESHHVRDFIWTSTVDDIWRFVWEKDENMFKERNLIVQTIWDCIDNSIKFPILDTMREYMEER